MLNEGLHVEDISGVIMARPTDSRIIYLQQLGRALSSDISRDRTIVFDLVNNYLKNNLDIEINRRTNRTRNVEDGHIDIGSGDETSDIKDIDIFRIQGETKEFLELLSEIQGITGHTPALISARKIKEWMEKNTTTKPPSASSKDEEEKKLGIALAAIRRNLIKPYMSIQSEDEKQKFEDEHPELFEILETINEIDNKNISTHLINIRKIKKWMDDRNTTKPPTKYSQKDEEERKLGRALDAIRLKLIKPYSKLQTEEEKLQFESEHPELQEILSVVNWIDTEKSFYELRNTLNEIKEWVDVHSKFPTRSQGASDIEQFLARKLAKIRTSIIKPYMVLQTDEERTSYREQHPELDEVMSIISELDIQCGNKKQQELAILIRQDLGKRKALREARKLEQEYEKQLSKSEKKDIQEQGVDFNE